MSELHNNKINILDSSLDFQKEFTYINIIQDELTNEKKPSRLKIHSKISVPYLSKNQTSTKKTMPQHLTCRSQIRKKSKTLEKSSPKKKKSAGKSLQKNNQNANKRSGKTIEPKLRELKSKSNRSLRSPITKKITKDNHCRQQDQSRKKKKVKDEMELRQQKTSRAHKKQFNLKRKVNKTKSSAEFQNIPLSSVRKRTKIIPTSNVVHDYFGMEDKLSSIIEEKNKNAQRATSRLSKCKTQSSSSSISHKNFLKFGPKKTKVQK